MKVAIIGSRNIIVEHLEDFLPQNITEIISGGAKGVDTSAKNYALTHNIKLVEFFPSYELYGRAAPLKRNEQIVQRAELILAFWDGKSRGTKYTINYARKHGVLTKVILMK